MCAKYATPPPIPDTGWLKAGKQLEQEPQAEHEQRRQPHHGEEDDDEDRR